MWTLDLVPRETYPSSGVEVEVVAALVLQLLVKTAQAGTPLEVCVLELCSLTWKRELSVRWVALVSFQPDTPNHSESTY